MKITLGEIAERVGGDLDGPADHPLDGVCGLADAGPTDLAYYADSKLEEELASCRAGCLLLSRRAEDVPWQGATIRVDHPQWAFVQIARLHQRSIANIPAEGVHPSACVSADAVISEGARILATAVVEARARVAAGAVLHPGAYVGADAVVGADTVLHPGAKLLERCVVGERCIIGPGSVLGSEGFGYLQIDGRHEKIPQLGRVVVEDDVEIGANVTIDRATSGETRLGRGCKIDNLVQIAHNVSVGEGCILVAQVGVAGSSHIGEGAILAGQVGIPDHMRIGKRAVVMAQSGVLKEVPDGGVVLGSPARPARESLKIHALMAKLPEIYRQVKRLTAAADRGGAPTDGT